MKELHPLLYTLYTMCTNNQVFAEQLCAIEGAIELVIDKFKSVLRNDSKIDCSGRIEVYISTKAPVWLLRVVSKRLLNDRHPEVKDIFLETDLSTTLVNGLKSSDEDIFLPSAAILAELGKISRQEVEKLQKVEGLEELLEKLWDQTKQVEIIDALIALF